MKFQFSRKFFKNTFMADCNAFKGQIMEKCVFSLFSVFVEKRCWH